MALEKRRAKRIRRTLTVASRRRAWHLARIHAGDVGQVDCVCELAPTYFAKRGAVACDCRKRRKGNPRVARGMCNIGDRERIYEWRLEARLLADAVRAGRDELGEPVLREWPAAKEGPKPYTIEKRDLNRAGEPVGDWEVTQRRYRTEADRDNALHGLRANVTKYDRRTWSAGEVAPYRGPRSEFRAGVLDPEKDPG